MIPAEALLDAFIDANILIVVAVALWCLARVLVRYAGVRHAHSTELRLLNGVFLAILCSPLLAMFYAALKSSGFASGVNLNLSDMVVSHYLNGGFDMKATEFERLLALREGITRSVVSGEGWLAWTVISVFARGTVIAVARLTIAVFHLHRIVSESYAWRQFGNVRILISDRTLVPFSTRGLTGFYVIIPSHMLGQRNELRVSLAHEFQHLRQGDIGWEIVLEALKPLFFLNPAFHAWKRQVEDLRELSCECEVLRRGRVSVGEYCDTLLSVCQQTLRRDRLFSVAVPKVALVSADRSALRESKTSFLERRVLSLLEAGQFKYPKVLFGGLILPLVASVMLTALAIQSPGDWSHDRLMLSTVVNLERLDEINRASTFGQSGPEVATR